MNKGKREPGALSVSAQKELDAQRIREKQAVSIFVLSLGRCAVLVVERRGGHSCVRMTAAGGHVVAYTLEGSFLEMNYMRVDQCRDHLYSSINAAEGNESAGLRTLNGAHIQARTSRPSHSVPRICCSDQRSRSCSL